mgnify:CR=1 FL=1
MLSLLQQLNLTKLTPIFQREELSLEDVLELDHETLKVMGVEKQKDRKYKQFSQHIKGNQIYKWLLVCNKTKSYLDVLIRPVRLQRRKKIVCGNESTRTRRRF